MEAIRIATPQIKTILTDVKSCVTELISAGNGQILEIANKIKDCINQGATPATKPIKIQTKTI